MTLLSRQQLQVLRQKRQSHQLAAKRLFTILTSAVTSRVPDPLLVCVHNPAQSERLHRNGASLLSGNVSTIENFIQNIFRRHSSYNSKVILPSYSTGSSSQSYHSRSRSYDRPSSYDFSTSKDLSGSTTSLASTYSSASAYSSYSKPYSSITSGVAKFTRCVFNVSCVLTSGSSYSTYSTPQVHRRSNSYDTKPMSSFGASSTLQRYMRYVSQSTFRFKHQ